MTANTARNAAVPLFPDQAGAAMTSDPTAHSAHDSFGDIELPPAALWGAQTERARRNFQVSGTRLPTEFISALALIKAAAAKANARLDLLPHASSNDCIPSAIHVSAVLALRDALLPALDALIDELRDKEDAWARLTKTGRTHLMDAMPLTLGQEVSGWRAQIEAARDRLVSSEARLLALAQGGTAVGTGINAHPRFAVECIAALRALTGVPFTHAPNYFAALAGQDTALEFSGQLRVLAVAMMKMANDLRWMGSGPLAGLGELQLPALQPGSSIMPGKVNPVIPEAVAMVAAQVMGLDAAIAIAGQSGNFQLNVMLPLIAHNLLTSLSLLANAARALAAQCIAGAEPVAARLQSVLARNPILATALNPVIGYERAAAIAKRAYSEGRPIFDVALEDSGLSADRLRELLDPAAMTAGGLGGDHHSG
jgi:fumarate hydratase class II